MKKLLITLLALTCYFDTPLNAMNTSNQVTRRSHSWQGMPEVIHQSIFEFLTDKELVSKLATLSKDDLSEINKYFARIYPNIFFASQHKLFYPVSSHGADWWDSTYDTTTALTSLCKVAKLNTIPQPTDPRMNLSNSDFRSQCTEGLCALYPHNTFLQSLKTARRANRLTYDTNFDRLQEDTTLTPEAKASLQLEQNALRQAYKKLEESIILELFKTAHKNHNSFFIYYFNLVTQSIVRNNFMEISSLRSLCYIIKAFPSISNTYLRTTLFNQLHVWMNQNRDALNSRQGALMHFHLELLALYNHPVFHDLVDPATHEALIAQCSQLLNNHGYHESMLEEILGRGLLENIKLQLHYWLRFLEYNITSNAVIENVNDVPLRIAALGQTDAFDPELLTLIKQINTKLAQLNGAPVEVIEEID